MNFKTGQKVVCINDQFRSYCAYPIKKGVIYTIDGFYMCACGSSQVTLAERPCTINMKCRCSRISNRRQSYYDWRFVPLELLENIIEFPSEKKEETTETAPLEKELRQETVNILIGSMEPGLKRVLCDEWRYYYSN